MKTDHPAPLLLPWRQRLSYTRTFQVAVRSPRARLVAHLRERTASSAPGAGKPRDAPLVGTIGGEEFSIRGFQDYRSSFLPFIRGCFADDATGVTIRLKMRPHREVIIFLTLWYFFLLLCSFFVLLSSLGTGASRLLLLTVPLGLGGLTWILSTMVFDSDCRWALKILKETLPGGSGAETEAAHRISGERR